MASDKWLDLPIQGVSNVPADLRLAGDEDVGVVRRLVNSAYQELADRGFNFTGSYQDDEQTRERMQNAEVYLLCSEGKSLATICLSIQQGDLSLGQRPVPGLYVSQLAVCPEHKRKGLGSYLLDFAEMRARSLALECLRLDTAMGATHLVDMYTRRGYCVVAEVQWDGKTYRSVIMEKSLGLVP